MAQIPVVLAVIFGTIVLLLLVVDIIGSNYNKYMLKLRQGRTIKE